MDINNMPKSKFGLFIDIYITIAVGIYLRFVVFKFSIESVVIEIILDSIIFFSVLAILLGKKLFAFRGLINSLIKIHDRKDVRKPFIDFLVRTVKDTENTLSSAFSKDGVEVTKLDVDYISQKCFRFGKGVYHGTDSNVPSEFKKQFPQYLQYQEQSIIKAKESGIRIVIVTQEDFITDFKKHYDDCEVFIRWHESNTISLLQINPNRSKELAVEANLKYSDIGIWDNNIAVLFGPLNGTKKKIMIRDKSMNEFDSCKSYFLSLVREAKKIDVNLSKNIIFRQRNQNEIKTDLDRVKSQWSNI